MKFDISKRAHSSLSIVSSKAKLKKSALIENVNVEYDVKSQETLE